MSCDYKKVLSVAEAEVGYLEKKDKSNLDHKTENSGDKNYTKYARDLDAIGFYNGRKNGFAWCDVFVDWCFVQAYGVEAAAKLTFQPVGKSNCGAGCRYSRQYYKKNGRLFDTPQPGDQIFFYPKDAIGGVAIQHTGLVYAVDDTYVYTVEGNTNGANGVVANGGGVCKKQYRRDYARIAGYGRPGYSEAETPSEQPPVTSNIVGKRIEITGASVNVRRGNSTKYAPVETMKKGETMPWVATAENGWHAGETPYGVVWVSDKYAKVVED